MKNFFSNLGNKLRVFMSGRYGTDELNRFIIIVALILAFISSFFRYVYFLSLILLGFSIFRMLSRNIYKRQNERNKYLSIKNKITSKFKLWKDMFRDRKTHKYYVCPNCKAVTRIKKPGHGRTISIHCPKCNQNFEKRT